MKNKTIPSAVLLGISILLFHFSYANASSLNEKHIILKKQKAIERLDRVEMEFRNKNYFNSYKLLTCRDTIIDYNSLGLNKGTLTPKFIELISDIFFSKAFFYDQAEIIIHEYDKDRTSNSKLNSDRLQNDLIIYLTNGDIKNMKVSYTFTPTKDLQDTLQNDLINAVAENSWRKLLDEDLAQKTQQAIISNLLQEKLRELRYITSKRRFDYKIAQGLITEITDCANKNNLGGYLEPKEINSFKELCKSQAIDQAIYINVIMDFEKIDSLLNRIHIDNLEDINTNEGLSKLPTLIAPLNRCISSSDRGILSYHNQQINRITDDDLSSEIGNKIGDYFIDWRKKFLNEISILIDRISNIQLQLLEKNKLDILQKRLACILTLSESSDIFNLNKFISLITSDNQGYDININKLNTDLVSDATGYIASLRKVVNSYLLKDEISKNANNPHLSAFDITENYFCFDEFKPSEFANILKLDVYNYFNIKGIDTPLKKQVYESSSDFIAKLKELKDKKTRLENKNYYFTATYWDKIKDPHNYLEPTTEYTMSNYDLCRGGFIFRFNNNNNYKRKIPSKVFRCLPGDGAFGNDGLFISLASKDFPLTPKSLSASLISAKLDFYDEIFIPIDKANAVEMEEFPKNVKVLFATIGKISFTHDYIIDMLSESHLYFLSTEKFRMIIFNEVTGKTYYERVF